MICVGGVDEISTVGVTLQHTRQQQRKQLQPTATAAASHSWTYTLPKGITSISNLWSSRDEAQQWNTLAWQVVSVKAAAHPTWPNLVAACRCRCLCCCGCRSQRVGGCTHLSRKDCGGRVCFCHGHAVSKSHSCWVLHHSGAVHLQHAAAGWRCSRLVVAAGQLKRLHTLTYGAPVAVCSAPG